MRINLYYGPLKEFNVDLPNENTISLSELVRWVDARRTNPIEDELIGKYDYLIISTDEYSGVTDAFIERFLIGITMYREILGYSEIYLHNPPTRIFNQLKIYSDVFDISIKYNNYSKVSKENLKFIKNNYEKKIIGQPHVKNEILKSIYDMSTDKDSKPKILMLYGPPGVWKTETAYFINDSINTGNALLRKQFSMYHNDSFYSYIFGDKTNSFSKDLMDRESNIILLDEFDKCNRTFFSAFYQLFDEGIFSDKYYEVNLKNAIIICTSNYLSENDIRKNLGEAIYSRIDAFIQFVPLPDDAIVSLIDRIYSEEVQNLSEEEIEVITPFNIPELLKSQVHKIQNARDIRRLLKQMIATPLIEIL